MRCLGCENVEITDGPFENQGTCSRLVDVRHQAQGRGARFEASLAVRKLSDGANLASRGDTHQTAIKPRAPWVRQAKRCRKRSKPHRGEEFPRLVAGLTQDFQSAEEVAQDALVASRRSAAQTRPPEANSSAWPASHKNQRDGALLHARNFERGGAIVVVLEKMSTWIEFGVWRRGPESEPNALILIWEKRFQCMNFSSLPVAIMSESV